MPRTSDQSSDFHTPQRLIPDPEIVSCPSCGRENPASHKFCGSCGATLLEPNSRQTRSEEQQAHSVDTERREPEPFEHSITNPNELSLFRSFRPSDSTQDGYWAEEQRSPYRVYIALVLALMIAGLGYMAWRTSKSGAMNAHEAPPAPVSAEKAPAPAPAAPSAQPEASAPKSAEPTASDAAKPPRETTKAAKPTAPAAPPAAESSAVDNGSSELAEARRYLAAHDSADASKFLWKSIAKHNGEATVLLADLYLKGDGVSKNCDQARVLLDSAARKGVSGAGERLRNLQAFGCQ